MGSVDVEVVEPVPVPENIQVPDTGMKVVCYYTNWAWYRQGIGKYKPEDIDWSLCTHINYGFAVLDPNRLEMTAHDSWADIDNDFYKKVTDPQCDGPSHLRGLSKEEQELAGQPAALPYFSHTPKSELPTIKLGGLFQ